MGVQDSARVDKRHSRGLTEENPMAISVGRPKQQHLGTQRKGKRLILPGCMFRGPRDVQVTDATPQHRAGRRLPCWQRGLPRKEGSPPRVRAARVALPELNPFYLPARLQPAHAHPRTLTAVPGCPGGTGRKGLLLPSCHGRLAGDRERKTQSDGRVRMDLIYPSLSAGSPPTSSEMSRNELEEPNSTVKRGTASSHLAPTSSWPIWGD